MSRFRLPPEISDHVVDLLHKEPDALKMCCLVSKSWVPRAQKHLFRKVVFNSPSRLQAWRDTFPDPVNSPTNHTRSLRFTCEESIPAALFGKGAWPQSFSNVVRLIVWVHEILGSVLFELVCSLPHLEDLQITDSEVDDDFDDNTIFPLTSAPLTGALDLCVPLGMGLVVRRLLELPNGIRFRKLEATVFSEEDLRHAIAVVEECSETLECIEILCGSPVSPWAGLIDFSEVINLKDVAFGLAGPEDVGIAMALETITSKHADFRKVSFTFQIDPPDVDDPDVDDIRNAIVERVYRQWMDLDRALFQLWESKKIHTKVIYAKMGEVGDALEYVVALLPEMTKRGLVEIVDMVDDEGYVPWGRRL